jgi:hypothetical protein
MSRLGFEPGPPAWEASTLEKSHLDSLSAGYLEPLLSRHLLTTFGPLQNKHYWPKIGVLHKSRHILTLDKKIETCKSLLYFIKSENPCCFNSSDEKYIEVLKFLQIRAHMFVILSKKIAKSL